MKKFLFGMFAFGALIVISPQAHAAPPRAVISYPHLRVAATPTPTPTPTPSPTPLPVLDINKVDLLRRVVTSSPSPTPIVEPTPIETFSGMGELEVSKIGQDTWLNPQPEPPLPATLIKKMSQLPAPITSETPAFLPKIEFALAKNNIPLVGNIAAETRGNQSLYRATINMPAKLFGLIPITLLEKIEITDKGTVTPLEKPWYAKLSREQVDLVSQLSILPNLVVKNITFEPAQFKQGDKVKVIATIANEGLGLALGFPDIIGNSGGPTEVLRWLDEGSMAYSWYPIIVYLEPGQTEERADFYVNSVKCGANMSYEIAKSTSSHLEETTKDDNFIQFKLDCSQ